MPDEEKPEGETQQPREPETRKPAGDEAAKARTQETPAEEAVVTPKAEFAVIVSTIATQALVSLGKIKNPLTNKKQVDLESAEFSVDLLQVLTEKTRGNLTDTEKRYLDGVLYQLRMAYVEATGKPPPQKTTE